MTDLEDMAERKLAHIHYVVDLMKADLEEEAKLHPVFRTKFAEVQKMLAEITGWFDHRVMNKAFEGLFFEEHNV